MYPPKIFAKNVLYYIYTILTQYAVLTSPILATLACLSLRGICLLLGHICKLGYQKNPFLSCLKLLEEFITVSDGLGDPVDKQKAVKGGEGRWDLKVERSWWKSKGVVRDRRFIIIIVQVPPWQELVRVLVRLGLWKEVLDCLFLCCLSSTDSWT